MGQGLRFEWKKGGRDDWGIASRRKLLPAVVLASRDNIVNVSKPMATGWSVLMSTSRWCNEKDGQLTPRHVLSEVPNLEAQQDRSVLRCFKGCTSNSGQTINARGDEILTDLSARWSRLLRGLFMTYVRPYVVT